MNAAILVNILFIIIIALVGVLGIIVISSKNILFPFLKCKIKGYSLLMLSADDGSLRVLTVKGSEIDQFKKYGAWVFDKKSRYSLNGVTCFFGYVRGPAVTASVETFIAASKMKSLGISPAPNMRQSIDAAVKADDSKRNAVFFEFVRSLKSKSEWDALQKELDAELKAHADTLTVQFYDVETQTKLMGEIEAGYTLNDFLAENLKNVGVVEWWMSNQSEEEFGDLVRRSNFEYSMSAVDLNSLYEYASAQNPHVVHSKIQRGIAEYVQTHGLSGKFTMQSAMIFIVIILTIGIVAYMIMNGSAQGAVDAGAGAIGGAIPNLPL
ncbi:MAG: hypothetical protein LBE57_04835 [Methanosarcinales archaeon]|jgi:small-conductance mechanosensitive channel|nr:hypothetical protein [Methanosarcinales archaeon]